MLTGLVIPDKKLSSQDFPIKEDQSKQQGGVEAKKRFTFPRTVLCTVNIFQGSSVRIRFPTKQSRREKMLESNSLKVQWFDSSKYRPLFVHSLSNHKFSLSFSFLNSDCPLFVNSFTNFYAHFTTKRDFLKLKSGFPPMQGLTTGGSRSENIL